MTAVDPFERPRLHRDRMYAARQAMAKTFRRYAPTDAAADCGKVRGPVEMSDHGGTWHATGFETCCITALCPACSVAPRLRRRLEIALAVQRWMAEGRHVVMVTYALPHAPKDQLDVTFERLRASWRRALDTQPGRRWRRRCKVAHMVKATEVTFHRDRGAHPHMHVLLFLDIADEFYDPEYGTALSALTTPLWHASKAEGRDRPWSPTVGWDVTLVRDPFAADYLSKLAGDEQGVGAEVVQLGHQKDGRNGSIAAMAIPYALAQAGCQRGDPAEHAKASSHIAWLQRCMLDYRRVTFGQSLLSYSKGLRAALIPDLEELSDEALVKMGAKLRGEYRQAHPAPVAAEGGEATLEVAGPDDADAPADPDEEDDRPRALTITPDVWSAWARTLVGHRLPAAAVACRRAEEAGAWRLILDMACAVDQHLGAELHVWRRRRRLTVGLSHYDVPPGWDEIPADDWLDLAAR